MIAIHTGVHLWHRVGKIKNSGVCRPLQWLKTRMIEDDKSHVSTDSKDYRYPPNIHILKPTQQGLYIRHTGDQNR